MKSKVLTLLKFSFVFIWCLPHVIVLLKNKNRKDLIEDIRFWISTMNLKYKKLIPAFLFLLGYYPEFRSLFYFRIGPIGNILNIFCPRMRTLYILTKKIEGGFFIRHGFSTLIGAESIGKNCLVHQQVTIGTFKEKGPVIKDNVTIYSGAIIFGDITIGNNVIIGANTTVYENVKDNTTVLSPKPVMMNLRQKIE